MKKDKKDVLEMLYKKLNKELNVTYEEISRQTGYSRMQLSRLTKKLKEKDIDSILIHGNTGRKPAITASAQEVEYIKEFKKQYPIISISQFQDIYHEDVIFNP